MKAARRVARPRSRLTVEDRRQQLIELGLETFSSRPYDEISTDEIAESAGISRGLLFHYFPTKHEYYVAVLQAAAEQLVREVVAAETLDAPPSQRLNRGLDAYFKFVEGRAETYATLLRAGVGRDPIVQRLVEKTRTRILEAIQKDLRALGVDRRLARAALVGWIGFVEALALDWCDHKDLSRKQLVDLSSRALTAALPVPG